MKIPLDSIDFTAHQVRRRYEKAAIARMAQSLGSAGQQQPIIFIQNGSRHMCVDGRHRVEAARLLGWTEIWAVMAPGFTADAELIASTVSNSVRMPLDPLDEWRMVVDLQADGRSLAAAAAALGITDRRARQLDRLGRLDASILKLIEEDGELPPWTHLGHIASAPQDVQAKAARAKDAVMVWKSGGVEHRDIKWHEIARRCTKAGTRISRITAIFDVATAGVAFDQDIFAEPGSRDEWTTADVPGFMAAQKAALEAEAAARIKGKQQAAIVEYSASGGGMKLPPRTYDLTRGDPSKPKKGEIVLMCLRSDGSVMRETAIDVKAARAAADKRRAEEEKKARGKTKPAAAPVPREAETDDPSGILAGDEDEGEPAASLVADISPVTKAGRDTIAAAKTLALRDTLRAPLTPPIPAPFRDLCAMLVLALHAGNVEVRGYRGAYQREAGADLVAQIVNPAGQIDLPDDVTLATIARETLARILFVGLPSRPGMMGNPDSGPVAEWIGAALRADTALPRFDAETFLATVNATELRPLALSLTIKPNKPMGDLRRDIAGKAKDWRPPGATFGAPGPKPPEKPATIRENAA